MAIIDKILGKFTSKKLFAFIVVTVVTIVGAIFDAKISEYFYYFASSYVVGQSVTDAAERFKRFMNP